MTERDDKRLRARYRQLLERAIFELGQAVDAARELQLPTGVLKGILKTLRRLLDAG